MTEKPERQADLLYGVTAIASFLRMRERQARHRIEKNLIPTFRIEGTICARESTLNAWLAERETEAQQARPAGKGERPGEGKP